MLKFAFSYSILIMCSLFVPNNKGTSLTIIEKHESIVCDFGDLNMISIYPNPLTGDVMFLKAPRNTGFLVLYNQDGEKVFRQDFEEGTNEYDISEVDPGTYNVNIISDGSMSVAKFEICRW